MQLTRHNSQPILPAFTGGTPLMVPLFPAEEIWFENERHSERRVGQTWRGFGHVTVRFSTASRRGAMGETPCNSWFLDTQCSVEPSVPMDSFHWNPGET